MEDNTDLIRRYCPGLAVHTFDEVARHIHIDGDGCWPWDGRSNAGGYGTVGTNDPEGLTLLVHRYMYETLVGPISAGTHVHHRCEYPPCWHPCHLEALTPKEHTRWHRGLTEEGQT